MGWQIPNARIQTAYARGMARSAGIRWGIYYECWCYNHAVGALTIPHSLRRGQDEWFEDQVTKGTGADRTPEEREEGGTSRNLQERLWRYAYLSGAEVMAEEYGVCNTFRDYRDFDLSPYGKTKKDFLSFTERFPDPGEAFTPIAVVLPKDLPVLHVDLPDDYLGYPAKDTSDGPDPQIWKRIRETLPEIFGRRGERGNNAHVLTLGGLPDVFDILGRIMRLNRDNGERFTRTDRLDEIQRLLWDSRYRRVNPQGLFHLYAKRPLKAGQAIAEEDLDVLRPALGIPPKFRKTVIGKRVNKDIPARDPIFWEDLS